MLLVVPEITHAPGVGKALGTKSGNHSVDVVCPIHCFGVTMLIAAPKRLQEDSERLK